MRALRATAAAGAVRATNRLSRVLGRGAGTVAGGRVGLALDPGLLAELSRGRRIALVTGTNGKTTTTRMLVAALSGGEAASTQSGSFRRPGAVATNGSGANMPAGHVAALAVALPGTDAVLEVDESYLDRLITETGPRVVLLLNLSRDQLDRVAEVRMVVERWRAALGRLGSGSGSGSSGAGPPVVVANADDPMVAWAASAAPAVQWVGAGLVWNEDAVGCPACDGRIEFGPDGGWACDGCAFARPARTAWIEGDELVGADGSRHRMALSLPGRFNRANAAMVAVALPFMTGGPPLTDGKAAAPDLAEVLSRIGSVHEVAGRFSTITRNGGRVRLLLAKNPAGWTAIFDLLDEGGGSNAPVVLSVNARTADGLDPSWLWDVPFERLAGRQVVATGDRRLDLGVRLRYAEVDHTVVADPLDAIDRAASMSGTVGMSEFLGNYTAFADIRGRT